MFDIIFQNPLDGSENYRQMLQISHDRCNQLVTINNQAIGIVAAILIGLITFLGSAYFTSHDPNRYLAIIISIHISVITLIFWRYYAHVIDTEIVKTYERIVISEKKLHITYDLTLVHSLEADLFLEDFPFYRMIEKKNRSRIILDLILNNKVGSRFHNFWDHAAVILSLLLLIFQGGFILSIQPIPIHFLVAFITVAPLFYGMLFIPLYKQTFKKIKLQNKPTREELFSIVKTAIQENFI
jgi:hypothetical protein